MHTDTLAHTNKRKHTEKFDLGFCRTSHNMISMVLAFCVPFRDSEHNETGRGATNIHSFIRYREYFVEKWENSSLRFTFFSVSFFFSRFQWFFFFSRSLYSHFIFTLLLFTSLLKATTVSIVINLYHNLYTNTIEKKN